MDICRSLGTATIVALMAAHREVSRLGNNAPSILDQAAVTRMMQYLDYALTNDRKPAPPIPSAQRPEHPCRSARR